MSTIHSQTGLTQFASHMERPEFRLFLGGELAVFSRRSPDKSTSNEDAFAVLPISENSGVLALADGCGGQYNGLEAAQRAIEALAGCVAQVDQPANLRAAILDGFEAASRRVQEIGNGAATTLVVVEISCGRIRTYHVGDSQAMLVGARGKVKWQTRAHSPVGYALEAGMLTEDDALEHEDRHIVSNVLGSDEMHIDVGLPRPLSKRDTLVVGSDGLYDNLSLAEIVDYVRKRPLEQAADSTCAAVAQRMSGTVENTLCKPDDFTLLLFRPGECSCDEHPDDQATVPASMPPATDITLLPNADADR